MPKPTPIAVRAFAVLLAVASPGLRAATPIGDAHAGALEATLAGEYALQGGQLQEAATWYLRAARAAAGDAALAERAARIALLAGDDATAAEALALWRERAPRTLAMRAIETSLALRRGDEAGATELAVALAAAPDDGWWHALGALASGGSVTINPLAPGPAAAHEPEDKQVLRRAEMCTALESASTVTRRNDPIATSTRPPPLGSFTPKRS